MSRKKGKNSGFSKDEIDLWKVVTKDVKRMSDKGYIEPSSDGVVPAKPKKTAQNIEIKEKTIKSVRAFKGTEVDVRTAERFRRGQMEIEGTLDLHGMKQHEAQDALWRFIKRCHGQGKRCLLVITGKGSVDRPSVIKRKVPEWLEDGAVSGLILKTAAAKPHHGGAGAMYVLLRRQL